MCQGQQHLEAVMADYKRRSDSLSQKEQASLKDMKIVQEMYARGFEFVPIDLFKAHSRNFQIMDGKIMPSLNSIDGLGEKAADAIVEAAKDGPFLSKDDFRDRSKASKTIVEMLDSLGILGDLPESNQISLFDFMAGRTAPPCRRKDFVTVRPGAHKWQNGALGVASSGGFCHIGL